MSKELELVPTMYNSVEALTGLLNDDEMFFVDDRSNASEVLLVVTEPCRESSAP